MSKNDLGKMADDIKAELVKDIRARLAERVSDDIANRMRRELLEQYSPEQGRNQSIASWFKAVFASATTNSSSTTPMKTSSEEFDFSELVENLDNSIVDQIYRESFPSPAQLYRARKVIQRADSIAPILIEQAQLIEHSLIDLLKAAKANRPPDELNPLWNISIQISAAAQAVSAKDEDALSGNLNSIAREIKEFEKALSDPAERRRVDSLLDSFTEQAGKSLGDWKLYAAMIPTLYLLFGNIDIGTNLDNVLIALEETIRRITSR